MRYNARAFSVVPSEIERHDLPLIVIDEPQHVFLPHKDVARVDIDCWLKWLMTTISRAAIPSVSTLSPPRSLRRSVRRGRHCHRRGHRPRWT